LRSSVVKQLLIALVTVALTLVGTTSVLAQGKHDPPCVGVDAALGTDFEFYGNVGYSPDTAYLVQITYPNGDSIWPAAVTDGSGMWTEFWLGAVPGTYTANVFTWHSDKLIATCSLTVT
jgi:hypothetical protein